MAIFDFLKGNQFKKEAEDLKRELEDLTNTRLTIEQMSAVELKEDILKKQQKLKNMDNEILNLESIKKRLDKNILNREATLDSFRDELIDVQNQIELESFGLYQPKYDFATSIGYKAELDAVRSRQKQMIKDKTAVRFSDNWQVDGSKAKGRKMNNDNIKLILRSFNNECEAAINKVKYNNLPSIEKMKKESKNLLSN